MDPKCHEITRMGSYLAYGYQMKAYDKKCLKINISTRIDPKSHDGKRHDEFKKCIV